MDVAFIGLGQMGSGRAVALLMLATESPSGIGKIEVRVF